MGIWRSFPGETLNLSASLERMKVRRTHQHFQVLLAGRLPVALTEWYAFGKCPGSPLARFRTPILNFFNRLVRLSYFPSELDMKKGEGKRRDILKRMRRAASLQNQVASSGVSSVSGVPSTIFCRS